MKKIFECLVLILTFSGGLWAQQVSVTGTVIEASGQPLPGKGNFKSNNQPLIVRNNRTGDLLKSDIDNDGDLDLLLIGKNTLLDYPYSEPSEWFANINGRFEKVSPIADQEVLPHQINSAQFADIDQDGDEDLLIASAFSDLRIYENHTGQFTLQKNNGLKPWKGWWQSLYILDYDHDGDLDFFAGNMGQNNSFNISENTPLQLFVKDIDENGSLDPILFSYQKDPSGIMKSYPFSFWGNLFRQSPYFRGVFGSYKAYAQADLANFLTDKKFKDAEQWYINIDASVVVENLGDGTFAMHQLPHEAQWAPIYGFAKSSPTGTEELNLLIVGNDYGNEPFIGPLDALSGVVLRFDGQQFSTTSGAISGFQVIGNARDIKNFKLGEKEYFVVSQHNGPLQLFERQ